MWLAAFSSSIDLHRSSVLEANLEAGDGRPGGEQRLGRGHDTVDALRVGRGEDLFAGQVRVVNDAVRVMRRGAVNARSRLFVTESS
jgi:hypothetical protein